ncbi:MAG TPA: hypothetical protein VI451_21810 [Anaerolineales bacterium]|nr:hypothetical protein [Anaerolineales bacterium]
MAIPGSRYALAEGAVFITVPSSGTYTVTVESQGSHDFDLRIRNLQGVDTNLVQRITTYIDVPVTSSGKAQLTYEPENTGTPSDIAVDFENDGTIDLTLPPTGDVGPDFSNDTTPPGITIDLEGETSPSGWFIGEVMVTITASDEESGIAKVDYSTDFGGSIQTYTGPFTVNAEVVSTLIVKATDFVGNEGWSTIRVGPDKTFLPITISTE